MTVAAEKSPVGEQLPRRQSPQTIAWFHDLSVRSLLDLNPPYQRRSVWNQSYKDSFVDTVLLGFPAPPIFLYEDMAADGVARYSVVDGKQRLTTLFEFVQDLFPVSEGSPSRHTGNFFSKLDDSTRRAFWTYQFSVEILPTTDAATLNDVFARLNRNVARLTRQELRRARFSGKLAAAAESMADFIVGELPKGFPRIAESSARQMKDVEVAAQLLLLVEDGPNSLSQDELDLAYATRDEEWERQKEIERAFRDVIGYLRKLCAEDGSPIAGSRLRNQTDFYSLFGAVLDLQRTKRLPGVTDAIARLAAFIASVEDEAVRETLPAASNYYLAARSASNDLSRRRLRIDIVKSVLLATQ